MLKNIFLILFLLSVASFLPSIVVEIAKQPAWKRMTWKHLMSWHSPGCSHQANTRAVNCSVEDASSRFPIGVPSWSSQMLKEGVCAVAVLARGRGYLYPKIQVLQVNIHRCCASLESNAFTTESQRKRRNPTRQILFHHVTMFQLPLKFAKTREATWSEPSFRLHRSWNRACYMLNHVAFLDVWMFFGSCLLCLGLFLGVPRGALCPGLLQKCDGLGSWRRPRA